MISTVEHGNVEKLMKESEQEYYQTCIHIEVQFDNEYTNLMSEYFPDCPAERHTETTSRIFVDVPAKERLWKALLLSFGNKIKVVGPEEYKKELIETAKKFLSNYDI
jgi:predicted DNA-binding transcriptional regulator YafY